MDSNSSFRKQDSKSSLITVDSNSSLHEQRTRRWRIAGIIIVATFLAIQIVILAVVVRIDPGGQTDRCDRASTCGFTNPNGSFIDLREPIIPGPFQDLTVDEMRQLQNFLENHPSIRASKARTANLNSSFIFTMELLLAPKTDVLKFLDHSGPQPTRKAFVVIFRGDLSPQRIEEYICDIRSLKEKCEMLNNTNRRNPIEFSLRGTVLLESAAIHDTLLMEVDRQIGYILNESFETTFTQCSDPRDCLAVKLCQVGTGIYGDINHRKYWIQGWYNNIYHTLHPIDVGVLCDVTGTDVTSWKVEKIWYAGRLYDTFQDLKAGYNNGSIPKVKTTRPVDSKDLFSTLHRRGEPLPLNQQRPPTEVEPDGKRYSIKDSKVSYLGWAFNVRMSTMFGPAVNDVRFKGERIAYEISLAEIAVFYSGKVNQIFNFVDSKNLMGFSSKALVPGGDCPVTATLINKTFFAYDSSEPVTYDATFCLFEHNNGYPLRRHLSYDSFYAGMLDSVLVLRSSLTIANYDYIVDFIFHQNGIMETKLMSTGYIISSVYGDEKRPYGFRIHNNILGNIHSHLVHFKVDLDIGGRSNRYQTLDIASEEVQMLLYPTKSHFQTKFTPSLKRTEKEALHRINFDTPKYHLVFNNSSKTKHGESRAYRIELNGVSKQLLPEGQGNEPSISFARHQLVVTRHKDSEAWSSSIYAAADSARPVVNFSSFYDDNEDIVDEDLVFWITCGLQHIPHTEDLPVTPAVGNSVGFYLMPYNYYPECPSMGSRDALYIEPVDPEEIATGVKVQRCGQSQDQCLTGKYTLEEAVARNPDQLLRSRKPA